MSVGVFPAGVPLLLHSDYRRPMETEEQRDTTASGLHAEAPRTDGTSSRSPRSSELVPSSNALSRAQFRASSGGANALTMAGPLGTNSGAVHKRTSKPNHAWSRNKSRSRPPPPPPSAFQYGIGSPPLATLTAENRKRMNKRSRGKKHKSKNNKRYLEDAAPISAASKTPGGGLFPATPQFLLGAPSIRNDQLLNRPRQNYRSLPSSARGPHFAPTGERGILGISDVYNDDDVPETAHDLGDESLDYFGSNMGLIVLKGGSPEACGSGGSQDENDSGRSDVGSDEEAPENADAELRGMALQLDENQGLLKQRQQESRINHQAEYIQQLEDDNLQLRGQMIKMEEELERLRQKDEEHINLQERMYLLEEELRRLKDSGEEETAEEPEQLMAEDC